jgi:energy-coupling factor transporter ATP-binding protein EcfA2
MTDNQPTARQLQIEKAKDAISKGQSLIIIGIDGIGKSHFLNELHRTTLPPHKISLFIAQTTVKQTVMLITESIFIEYGLRLPDNLLPETTLKKARIKGFLQWEDIKYSISRLSTDKIFKIIMGALVESNCRISLFIDNLTSAPTQLEIYKRLQPLCQMIITVNSSRMRGEILKFTIRIPNKIELKPLSDESCKQIVEDWLGQHEIRFDSEKTKKTTLQHIIVKSDGNAGALINMLDKLTVHEVVSNRHAKELQTEFGTTYFDMTPIILLLGFITMAWRQISRGIGDMESYILTTIVFSGLLVIIFLWRASNRTY